MPAEENLIKRGVWPLCGVDEAGRGPLAGPVVAAAAILDVDSPLRKAVHDSKALSASRRERLFEQLTASSEVQFGIAIVDEQTIDSINILKASLLAMQQAVAKLPVLPRIALIDGNRTPQLPCEGIPVVGGDATEPSISAASILAKVTRDRLMQEMDKQYPGYGFAAHKGYPTKMHYQALRELGPCPIHRRTYHGVVQLDLF